MSSSGIGRGRGWLNINRNPNVKPGISPTDAVNYDCNAVNNVAVQPKLNPKYANVIAQFLICDEADDEVVRSKKIKRILTEIKKDCQNGDEVNEAMIVLHEQCLYSDDLTNKVIGVIFEQFFQSAQIHGVNLRYPFISQLQKDFDNSKKLQVSNPRAFQNTVKMLGGFLHRNMVVNGCIPSILVESFLKYLEMLLDSSTETDLQLFTIQLYINGNTIKEIYSTELSSLLLTIRKTLAHNDKLSAMGKLWLLMATDIANHRYTLLPTELQQFYVSQLGEEAMSHFKKSNTKLSIETNYQNTLDSVYSSVKVLQVNNSAGCEVKENEDTHPQPTDKNSSLNNIGTWEHKPEKTPRPILGAGSKLKGPEKEWRKDDWQDGKDNRKKSGGWGVKPKKNFDKGWEHDDRFSNEYN